MAPVVLDSNYGYVILAACSTFVLNAIHSINTGKYRKAAKIAYPAAYAPSSRTDPEAHRFNCAQRAHANYTENQPTLLGSLLLAGIRFPITSAIMGVAWSVCRYLYMAGYSEGAEHGKGRYRGIYYAVFQTGLLLLSAYAGVTMVME